MESQTHKIVISDAGGTQAQFTGTYQADSLVSISATALQSATLEEDVALDVSNIKAFYILSDQNVTLKTNSSGAPDQTIALTANKPLWWNTDMGANPLTVDITKLFFVNATLVDAAIKCGFIVDNIP